jgi:hypothetical protein
MSARRTADGGAVLLVRIPHRPGGSAGTTLTARVDAEGRLDLGYGYEGVARLHLGRGVVTTALAVDPATGDAWIGARNARRSIISRIDGTGHRQPGFGGRGVVTLPAVDDGGVRALAWRDGQLLIAAGARSGCAGCALTLLNAANGRLLARATVSPHRGRGADVRRRGRGRQRRIRGRRGTAGRDERGSTSWLRSVVAGARSPACAVWTVRTKGSSTPGSGAPLGRDHAGAWRHVCRGRGPGRDRDVAAGRHAMDRGRGRRFSTADRGRPARRRRVRRAGAARATLRRGNAVGFRRFGRDRHPDSRATCADGDVPLPRTPAGARSQRSRGSRNGSDRARPHHSWSVRGQRRGAIDIGYRMRIGATLSPGRM